MRRGFTLIEIAIVLIIIGFIIGGVLAATSMVSSSKVVKQISQLQQFDAAISTFKQEYGGLPGDITQFGGNGDGYLQGNPFYFANPYLSNFGCEVSNFWNQLDPVQFPGVIGYGPPGNCTGDNPPVTSGVNKNSPLSVMGNAGSFLLAWAVANGTTELADTATANKGNYYVIVPYGITHFDGSYDRFYASSATTSAVKPIDLAALDAKIDDGVANSGYVMSAQINSANSLNIGPYSTDCSSGAAYTTTPSAAANKFVCTPAIRIGSQSGNAY